MGTATVVVAVMKEKYKLLCQKYMEDLFELTDYILSAKNA
jgi:hypothetical protein